MVQRFGIRDAAGILQAPTTNDSKYTRGVIGLLTGSERYPGAAVLGSAAAARVGAGYVRYAGPEACRRLVLACDPEIVTGIGSADAWAIGSGMDGIDENDPRVEAILSLLDPASPSSETVGLERGDVPAIRVVDAGALTEFARLALNARRAQESEEQGSEGSVARSVARSDEGSESGKFADANRKGDASRASTDSAAGVPPALGSTTVPSSGSEGGTKAGADSSGLFASLLGRRPGPSGASASGAGAPSVPSSPALNRLVNDTARASKASAGAAIDREEEASDTVFRARSGSSAGPSASGGSHPLPGILRFNAAGYNGFTSEDSQVFSLQSEREREARRNAGSASASRQSLGQTGTQEASGKRSGSQGSPSGASLSSASAASNQEAFARASEMLVSKRRGNLSGPKGRNASGAGRADGESGEPSRPAILQASSYSPVISVRPASRSQAPAIVRVPRRSRGTGTRRLYVITPHSGELARLLRLLGETDATHETVEEDRLVAATRVRDALGCTVVLKGAHTLVVPEDGEALEVVSPTYWLATAGTGDVLAGAMAAVLGQLKLAISTGRVSLGQAVALAVFLHGYAGGIASGVIDSDVRPTSDQLGMAGSLDCVGHPVTALQVAQALPQAVGAVLAAGRDIPRGAVNANRPAFRS